MRSIPKVDKPEVLASNEEIWIEEYRDDPDNTTKRYRYRHRDIKEALKNETGFKCIYCESKIGHNTPGDVEHKVPSSVCIDKHFCWENLTIACTECNRRKNAYFDEVVPFLDPNEDTVEEMIEHLGPIVIWKPGHERAEVSIRILELNGHNRAQLIFRKIEKIEEVNNLFERYQRETSPLLKRVLGKQLISMAEPTSEYSGMVLDILEKKGLTNQSTRTQ
jgi:hypothetical protein